MARKIPTADIVASTTKPLEAISVEKKWSPRPRRCSTARGAGVTSVLGTGMTVMVSTTQVDHAIRTTRTNATNRCEYSIQDLAVG